MTPTLLDTDIISEVFNQRDAVVKQHAASYLIQYGEFTLSEFSRFEVRRGYFSKQATRQLARFDAFCSHCQVIPLTTAVFDRATVLWAHARQNGHPCGDADGLIAATALEYDLVLAKGNFRHFAWVPGLKTQD